MLRGEPLARERPASRTDVPILSLVQLVGLQHRHQAAPSAWQMTAACDREMLHMGGGSRNPKPEFTLTFSDPHPDAEESDVVGATAILGATMKRSASDSVLVQASTLYDIRFLRGVSNRGRTKPTLRGEL